MNNYLAYAMLGVAGFMLPGCGSMAFYQESRLYHDELDDKAAEILRQCQAGAKTSMTQNPGDPNPDCFDLVYKQSPRRIGMKPDTVPLRDGDKQIPPVSGTAYAYIDQFALMALFTKMVYHRFQDEDKRNIKVACLDEHRQHPLLSLYDDHSSNGRWRLWENGSKGCYAEGGLFMETYVYYPANAGVTGNGFTRAVIVFRGTENGQTQRFADWSANLATAFGVEPRQYITASAHVDTIVSGLTEGGTRTLPIYTAGHSLGGGLAQMAAYWSNHIHAAYAFNSSPVTAWTWIHQQRRRAGTLDQMNGDPTIYRVSQRSEALQAPRAVSTAVSGERFGRSDFDFDFRIQPPEKNATGRQKLMNAANLHDGGLLACHMAARVVLGHAGTSGKAAFDYTPDMALKVLLQRDRLQADNEGNHSLCSSENIKTVREALCKKTQSSALCLAMLADKAAASVLTQQADAAPRGK